MISVLIPTYNYSAFKLVEIIKKQLFVLKLPYEIICMDNGSGAQTNRSNEKINQFKNCRFEALEENIGRSKIRNLLAEKAQYNWLLFLDADVIPVDDQFIQNYIVALETNWSKVFFGGLKYENEPPSSDKILRWIYGKKREEISLEVRRSTNGFPFSSANFLIAKEIFEKIKFDESLTEYGHEDTLFAIELSANHYKIHQVDCPVYHLGLDDNAVFLGKTRKAVENLKYLYLQEKISSSEVKLLKLYERIKAIGFRPFLKGFHKVFFYRMEKNLISEKPSVFIYDLYKLGYFCSIS